MLEVTVEQFPGSESVDKTNNVPHIFVEVDKLENRGLAEFSPYIRLNFRFLLVNVFHLKAAINRIIKENTKIKRFANFFQRLMFDGIPRSDFESKEYFPGVSGTFLEADRLIVSGNEPFIRECNPR